MNEARITYNYALIDETGWCYEVRTTSRNCNGMKGYVLIPSFDSVYMDKYYNVADGKWYYDDAFQNEATELN